MLRDIIHDILYGSPISYEEAKSRLAELGIDIDTVVDSEPSQGETDDSNPYRAPRTPGVENPRKYFRDYRQELSDDRTSVTVSGRLFVEDPAAYREHGMHKPEILLQARVNKKIALDIVAALLPDVKKAS
ncbi:MAG: hypothetical protein Q8N99_03840 [Nanoarchaeota archaeon]|nr:hypothetical protein [Nanoarchaeota archaeon]